MNFSANRELKRKLALSSAIICTIALSSACATKPKFTNFDNHVAQCRDASTVGKIISECNVLDHYRKHYTIDEKDPNVIFIKNKYNSTLDSGNVNERLMKAISAGDSSRVKMALDQGADPNFNYPLYGLLNTGLIHSSDKWMTRPLWIAKDPKIVDLLAQAGADLNSNTENECTKGWDCTFELRHFAKSPETIKSLLQNNYKITLKDYEYAMFEKRTSDLELRNYVSLIENNVSQEIKEEYAEKQKLQELRRAQSENELLDRMRASASSPENQELLRNRAIQDAEKVKALHGQLGTRVCSQRFLKVVTHAPYLRWGELVKSEVSLFADLQARINRQSADGAQSEMQLSGISSSDQRMPSTINEIILDEERIVTTPGALFWDSTKHWKAC